MHGAGGLAGRADGSWDRSPSGWSSAGNLPGFQDSRMSGRSSYSGSGFAGDQWSAPMRPSSREDSLRDAQSHLVLLKSKIRQGRTGPKGISSREAFTHEHSALPQRGSDPLRNGRFEYVADGASGGYADSVASSGSRQRPMMSRGRGEQSLPRGGGGMTWDAPAVPSEEQPVPAVSSRAAAPMQNRRPPDDIPAYPSSVRSPDDMPAYTSASASYGSGGGSTPGFGGGTRQPVNQPPPAPTSLNSPDAYPQGGGQQHACPDCGRKFNAESIDRHMKICKKVFQTKRKEFSSAEARLNEFEDSHNLIAKAQRSQQAPPKKEKDPRTGSVPAWKKKSLEFRAAILAARADSGDAEAQQQAEEIQQQLGEASNQLDPDKVKCQHCGRSFNKEAGERHIAICVKTFGKKPGGGRLIKGGGQRMKLASDLTPKASPTGMQSGQLKDFSAPSDHHNTSLSHGRGHAGSSQRNTSVPLTSSAGHSAHVSRMGSSGHGLEAGSHPGRASYGGSSGYGSSVVRASSSSGAGLSASAHSGAGGYGSSYGTAGYAGPSAQNRRPSAHRAPSRGGSVR